MSDLTDATRRLLLSRIRMVMIGVGVVAGVLVLSSWLLDEGEIVKLTTLDAEGHDHVTEVWIVDLPSGTWIRAGTPEARWLERLRGRPEVVLERDDQERRFRALPDPSPETRQEVNRAMAEKYGMKDRFWARLSDHGKAVPIRLVPADAVAAGP